MGWECETLRFKHRDVPFQWKNNGTHGQKMETMVFSHVFCLLPYHSAVPNIPHMIHIYIYTSLCNYIYYSIYLYTIGGWEWLNKKVKL